ncbi:hypothetical protein BHE74_00036128 [Ensete ventricosum]|nr:hypothetical protein BHE74_00036128 [Ensete ventricosum]
MERNGSSGCPEMAFRYNGTLCACNPGRYLVNGSCALFETGGDWVVSSGVSPAPTFLTTVLPMDSIKRFTQSQAVLLEVTFVLLLVWLAFCLALRFTRSDNGRNFWFRLRWWISRFDTFYDTKHWLSTRALIVLCDSSKVCNFDLYRPVWVVHTGPSGYRYADRPLLGGSIKNRLLAIDFGRWRPIEEEIDRWRSIEREIDRRRPIEEEKGKKKRKRKKKKKRGRKNTLSVRHPRLPAVAARGSPAAAAAFSPA